jgi:putative MATE family efflux protein
MLKQNRNVLDTDQIGRLLIKLTLPLFIGVFVQTIYNVVDTIFIGRYVGLEGIATLSVVFPLQMLAIGLGNLAGIGGASLISRLIGSGDKNGAERALGNSLVVGIVSSLVLTAIILPNINLWVRLVGASQELLPYAHDYLTIAISGAVFNVMMNALMIFIRSEGNARVSMMVMVLGYGLNIVLDAVFIVGLNMGIRGAALAIVISQAVATVYGLSYYTTGRGYLRFHTRIFKPDFTILKSVLAIGAGQFAQTIAMSLSAMFIIKMAATYGGDLALSSFGIIQRILYFAIMPSMTIGQGMQPVLGYNYGARRYHLATRAILLASTAATILSIMAFLVLYLVPGPIIRVFTSDELLIAEGVHVMKTVFLALPLAGLFNVGQMVFPAVGQAVASFVIALARPAAFMIPLVIVLPRFFQLDGVWLSFPGSDALSFLLVVAMLVPLIRRLRKSAPGLIGQQAV